MNILDSAKLMEIYAACPKCGCEVIGNGKGTLECDTSIGYFRRTCACGWCVEVREGMLETPVTDLRQDLLQEAPPEVDTPSPAPEPVPPAASEPKPKRTRKKKAVPEAPAPAPAPVVEEPVEEEIYPWKGFVYVRCERCQKETATCLRTPTRDFICKECGHEMQLPRHTSAFINCECGARARYMTNVPEDTFDIPCFACGSPNTVSYNPVKRRCYPVSDVPKRSKPRKKK